MLRELVSLGSAIQEIDWPATWSAVGGIAAALTLLGSMAFWGFRRLKVKAAEEFAPIKAENERLRLDLDTRLRLPTFSLDAVRLTELGAEKRILELRQHYEQALLERNQEAAESSQKAIAEIRSLQSQISASSAQSAALADKLRTAVLTNEPYFSGRAIGLPTGISFGR